MSAVAEWRSMQTPMYLSVHGASSGTVVACIGADRMLLAARTLAAWAMGRDASRIVMKPEAGGAKKLRSKVSKSLLSEPSDSCGYADIAAGHQWHDASIHMDS
jgi:hypothetical protein